MKYFFWCIFFEEINVSYKIVVMFSNGVDVSLSYYI